MGQLILITVLSFATGLSGLWRFYAIGFVLALLLFGGVIATETYVINTDPSDPAYTSGLSQVIVFATIAFVGSLVAFLFGFLIRKIATQMSNPPT